MAYLARLNSTHEANLCSSFFENYPYFITQNSLDIFNIILQKTDVNLIEFGKDHSQFF